MSQFGGNDGSIQALVNGGVPPYNYNWNTGSNQAIISSIGAGTYSCTVTDAAGCITNINETLNGPSQLQVSISDIQHLSCNGFNDGSARAMASGGVGPYSYRWNSGESDSIAYNLRGGVQNLDVADRHGASLRISFEMLEPAPLTVSTSVSSFPNGFNVSCSGCYNGNITVTASGGTAPYYIMWMDSSDSFSRSQLGGGKHNYMITDNNGCKITDFTMLKEPERDDWSRSGNSNVDPNSQFIGTVDFTPMAFKTNGQEVLRIAEDGNVGIGTSAPEYKFDVDGNVRLKQNVRMSQLQSVTISESNNNLGDFVPIVVNSSGELFKSTDLIHAGIIEAQLSGECLERASSGEFITTWQYLPASPTNSKKIIFAGSTPACAPYVGIGTNSPLIDLHVEGSIYTSDRLQIGGSFDNNSTYGLLVNGRGLINSSLLIKNSYGLADALVIETGTSKFKNSGNHTLIIEHISDGEYNVANTITVDNSSTKALLMEGPASIGGSVVSQFIVNGDGSTIIGNDLNNDDLTTSKLKVYGMISARKFKVTLAAFPDYVFDEEYERMSLFELERFINMNKHLPGMPSEKEVVANGGFDLERVQLKSVEKIEELFLYVIELKKEIDSLQAKIVELESK